MIFGLEEWNNCEEFKRLKIGFVDSFRHHLFPEIIDILRLFTLRPDGQMFHVGNMYNVQQLVPNEIERIRNNFCESWLKQVEQKFNNVGDMREIEQNIEYICCYNSNIIIGAIGKIFIANLKYERMEIFAVEKRKNLTYLNRGCRPTINRSWRHLSTLYNIDNFIFERPAKI